MSTPADPSSTSAACEGWCEVAGSQTACELPAGHEYEHEATHEVEVFDAAGSGTLTNFLVWWGDDGHAFVGSKDARPLTGTKYPPSMGTRYPHRRAR